MYVRTRWYDVYMRGSHSASQFETSVHSFWCDNSHVVIKSATCGATIALHLKPGQPKQTHWYQHHFYSTTHAIETPWPVNLVATLVIGIVIKHVPIGGHSIMTLDLYFRFLRANHSPAGSETHVLQDLIACHWPSRKVSRHAHGARLSRVLIHLQEGHEASDEWQYRTLHPQNERSSTEDQLAHSL